MVVGRAINIEEEPVLKSDQTEVLVRDGSGSPRYLLGISEDITEEVGRVIGYDTLKPAVLQPQKLRTINKRQFYASTAREVLSGAGFSEVYTYAFTGKGEIEAAKPLAGDKAFLRLDLRGGLERALELNLRNADLLGLDEIAIFEIGTVFKEGGEFLHLGLALRGAKKGTPAKIINALATASQNSKLARALVDKLGDKFIDSVIEFDFDELVSGLPEPRLYKWPTKFERVGFAKISPYPYVVRDISIWVPEGTPASEPEEIIKSKAGELMVNLRLADSYKKENRLSYLFRLVFQSAERTLTDDEVNLAVWHVSAALNASGWEVR
jgi:phenylalanyl-tRNA synthetase beta subunit